MPRGSARSKTGREEPKARLRFFARKDEYLNVTSIPALTTTEEMRANFLCLFDLDIQSPWRYPWRMAAIMSKQ